MSINVCIGNYGYYNEGELRDAWISLPKTSKEIGDFLSAHGLQDPEHEEIYISDYDGVPFGLRGLFDEYTHLDDLNMLARQMEAHPGAVETVKGALGCGIDHPESVIGLMNWIEHADEIPYYAYDYPGAGRKDEWDQTEVERNSAEENYARTVIFRDEDKLRALMALDEVGLDHDMYFDFEKYGRSDDLSGYVNLGDGGYFDNRADMPDEDWYTREELAEMYGDPEPDDPGDDPGAPSLERHDHGDLNLGAGAQGERDGEHRYGGMDLESEVLDARRAASVIAKDEAENRDRESPGPDWSR